jgi:hypothetical protein
MRGFKTHAVLVWGPLSGLLLLAGCSPLRSYESVLVLADIGAAHGPSRLKAVTPAPSRTVVAYTVAGRRHTGDLYLPGEGVPLAGVVLVPGAVPKGKDDARLVAFAATLARARFAVLVPELPGFRELKIRPTDGREVADAFAYLASRPDLVPRGRAGIAAFSYAVGPAVLAALEGRSRDRVRFIVGVGGYYDLTRAIRFFTTGYFRENGDWRYIRPDDYGKLVFVESSMDYLPDRRDRQILRAMVEARLKDPNADLAPLSLGLGPQGRSVYELLTNPDPARTPALIAALPPGLKAAIGDLTLADKDLSRLTARLILVHGKNDNLIPYPESIALARAVAPGRARLFVIHRVLGHVDLSLSHFFSWDFLSRDLPDAWRMYRAVYLLLGERERE